MEENERTKIRVVISILAIIIILLTAGLSYAVIKGTISKQSELEVGYEQFIPNATNNTENEENQESESKDTNISNLNLGFLKLENQKVNKVYSPLSIKYALKMLEAGTTGTSKLQISQVVGAYDITRYNSNSNMALANALFIKDELQNNIKDSYINELKENYDADIIYDSFLNTQNINSWVSNNTLQLINNLIDNIDQSKNFLLINALAIDMDWENKFIEIGGSYCNYEHEDFGWYSSDQVLENSFYGLDQTVSGMEIEASINNYDILTELGEENIKKTVGDEFKKWAKSLTEEDWDYNDIFNGNLTEENIEAKLAQYLDGGNYYEGYVSEGYISELNSNYKRVDSSTDFSLYVDSNVKVFAKDLKEYDGTTLQYIGIMPINEELDSYIENIDENKINNIINNLKELKPENFKEGVVTKITGYIPKFQFDYELNLMEDLKQIGITNVFEEGNANLSEICDDKEVYIDEAIHKATIEFTQDGIKAAATTMFGGAGAGDSFDYLFDVPVEEIDLTFDKPYMFLIRDKETGEVWFVGTVYEPLLWEDEPENTNPSSPRT